MDNIKELEEILKEYKTQLEKTYDEKLSKEVEKIEEKIKAAQPVDEKVDKGLPTFNHNSGDALKLEFSEYMKNLPSLLSTQGVVTKDGVSITIPIQFDPLITLTPGNWNIKSQCTYVGRLTSDTLRIKQSISGGEMYWTGKSGSATGSSVSAKDLDVTMDRATAKIPIYDYQLRTMSPIGIVDYTVKEINKKFNKGEAKQIFAGNSDPFVGIYNTATVPTVSLGTSASVGIAGLSISALRGMVSKIYPDYRTPDLKWFCDMSEEETLLGVVDPNNRTTDITTGVSRMLGYEVVPVAAGVLNDSSITTTGSKHFILANLKEMVHYADMGMTVFPNQFETFGQVNYYFYNFEAFGVANPWGGCICKLNNA